MASRTVLALITAVVCISILSGCNENNTPETKENKISETKELKMTKQVILKTSAGDITIELDAENAPITVENFLAYTKEDFYSGTIFHRVIDNFMIQCGGMTEDMGSKQTHSPIKNEADNGLKNDRGTLAMARTNDPDSATSQFFINHKNNDFLNYTGPSNPGYAVFGKVVDGMDIVDKIASVKTTTKSGMGDVPAETITIESVTLIAP